MWAIPAFIARADTRTSGTNTYPSRNLMPTIPIPAMSPSSMISRAPTPPSSASLVSRSTVTSLSPSIRAAAMSCMAGDTRLKSATFLSISSGRSRNSSISSRMNSLAMSNSWAMEKEVVGHQRAGWRRRFHQSVSAPLSAGGGS